MDLFATLSTYPESELMNALFDPRLAPGNPDLDLLNPANFLKLGRIPLLNVNLVRALIDNGHLDVNAKMQTTGDSLVYIHHKYIGCTILHFAVMWANFELIEMLVDKNADVNLANDFVYENVPLNAILNNKDFDWDSAMRIRLLRALNAKGTLDIRANGHHTPLWDAILLGVDILDEFILMGANVNEKMRETFHIDRPTTGSKCSHLTVFTYAVVLGRFDVAHALKRRGADTEVEGIFNLSLGGGIYSLRPLEFVCLYGTVGELERLLNIGVNVNAVDDVGKTALRRVAERLMPDRGRRCEVLIYHNADVSLRSSARTGMNTALEIGLNDEERLLMEQALERRRIFHAWALFRSPHQIPTELVPRILLQNGL